MPFDPTSNASDFDDRGNFDKDVTNFPDHSQDRQQKWAGTMHGHAVEMETDRPGASGFTIRTAHKDDSATIDDFRLNSRQHRASLEHATLSSSATVVDGAGNRAAEELPDPIRTCFERDRDRILHSSAFRRLAGKTQVFIFPDDHQRTRLTHALEVAQVAVAIARNLRLNTALTEAIALGHDCGHGAGGHASEDALSPFLTDGFDHATWGADVALKPLNLCEETLDGIRNHSWSRPSPRTPEGVVVSWADRIAYVCHDLEDAVSARIVSYRDIPDVVREHCGSTRREQLSAFIDAITKAVAKTGQIGMLAPHAEALGELRRFNYENVYLRPESREQNDLIVRVLRQLVEFYITHPSLIADTEPNDALDDDVVFSAVRYTAGMTDRFAFQQAITHLGWQHDDFPTHI